LQKISNRTKRRKGPLPEKREEGNARGSRGRHGVAGGTDHAANKGRLNRRCTMPATGAEEKNVHKKKNGVKRERRGHQAIPQSKLPERHTSRRVGDAIGVIP